MDGIITMMLESIYGGGLVQATYDALMIFSSSYSSSIADTMGTISDFLKPIAGVIVCMYFLMNLIDKATTDNFSSDQFIKMLLKLAFSIIIIENITDWSVRIMDFGIAFTNGIASSISGISDLSTLDMQNIVENMGFWSKLGGMAILLIPWAISLLVRLGIYFLVYGRAIEIGVRAIFSPIGCSDLMNGGVNSNGFKYIKKMLAVSIQGGVMLIVVICSSLLTRDVFANDLGNGVSIFDLAFIAKYLGVSLSMVGIMAASKQIANDIIGA